MSMISAQIDELRLMARLVREYEYKEISRMLREAADTISVMDERLRESERHHRIDMDVVGLMYHPEIVERLEAENDKLRELALALWDAALHPTTFGDGSYLHSQMRKLGIEVQE